MRMLTRNVAMESSIDDLVPRKLELYEDGTHPDARGAFRLARLVVRTLGWGFEND